MPDHTALFEPHRQLLFGVAYRLLGTAADAEDVVQDAWLRWAAVDPSTVHDPRAFLVRTTTRLALDRLRRLKARRETYIGPWLPEPVLTDSDVANDIVQSESISFALLVVLETLSPLERAVFVLHEVFGVSHQEIAEILDRSPAAIRQLATRARNHVHARRPRFEADAGMRRRVTERFLNACRSGSINELLQVLAPEVTMVTDGGGRVRAARMPLHGADAVARFLAGVLRPPVLAQYLGLREGEPVPELDVQLTTINGGPAIIASAAGRPIGAVLLDVAHDQAQTIHLVSNPDKLTALTQPSRSR